jgi:hypothetical protein
LLNVCCSCCSMAFVHWFENEWHLIPTRLHCICIGSGKWMKQNSLNSFDNIDETLMKQFYHSVWNTLNCNSRFCSIYLIAIQHHSCRSMMMMLI